MSHLGLFRLAPHLTTFDIKLHPVMFYPGFFFIGAKLDPFYQEITTLKQIIANF